MKVPEFLFKIINPVMRMILRSPVHKLFSRGVLLITFVGRNSGRQFTTPVRYFRTDDTIRCLTAKQNQWWRNLREGARVKLLVEGRSSYFNACAVFDNPEHIRKWLLAYLDEFPEDAVYHDIRRNKDGSLVEDDLEKAVNNAVVVEATPVLLASDAENLRLPKSLRPGKSEDVLV